MFRGGRAPNPGRRPGDAQVNNYNRGPNNHNNKPRDSRDIKPSDSKPPPSKDSGKAPQAKPDDRNGGRPRSRSPINRNEKEVPAEQAPAAGEQSGAAVPEEKPAEKKYTGRPGEKKFNGRCRLFVANLSNTTTEDELKEVFNEFGETGEVYVNKEKGFGFIRLDYRHNAEMAKLSLDKKLVKGRNIQVRYATHASAIELHGLDNYASNDFILRAMSTFGAVERCVVVCDDRGRSKGYAIVEFEWKKSAAKVLDRLKDEMFVLGRLPKPVFAKPFVMSDEEEGVPEEALERLEGLEQERSHEPRFISPNSFEYTWAKRWRDLFIEEQDKKAKLESEMTDARCKLEFEMEAALRQAEASRIREELARRQEELRLLSEDMMRRQEADMRILERSRQREMAARAGNPEPPPRDEQELHQNEVQLSRENAARHHDFMKLRERAENAMQDPFNGPPRGGPDGGWRQQQQGGMPQELMGVGGGGGFNQQRGGPQGQQGFGGGHGGHQGGPQGGGQRPNQMGMDPFRGPPQQRGGGGPPHQRGGGPDGGRDIPAARDQPARDLVREAPKDKPADEKPAVGKPDSPAKALVDIDLTKAPNQRPPPRR